MRALIASNKTASILALFGLAALVPGYLLPFVAINKLGSDHVYTLPSSIVALIMGGELLIGIVLFVFSICFPIAKLALTLMSTNSAVPLGPHTRQRVRKIVTILGKYSMLDIFVVALLVVLMKMDGLVEAKLRLGTAFFCVAILLSMASGQAMTFDHLMGGDMEKSPAKTGAEKTSGPRRFPLLWVLSAAVLMAGVALAAFPMGQTIDAVKLTKKKEFIPELGEIFDDPDYYLSIQLKGDEIIKTQDLEDKLIGNGIIWDISPVPYEAIREVTVMDENFLGDSALDRVTVYAKVNEGQKYIITLMGPVPISRLLGELLAAIGGVTLIVLSTRIVLKQAV